MTVEEWLGKDNKLGIDIWHKKYQQNNETFDHWLDRISNGNYDAKRLIKEKKFLYGGRTLSNRGVDNDGSLFNCYSRGFVEDNYKDIMQICTDIGLTFKAQGGQGVSLSKIRPKGAPITGNYQSDGIIPFMKIYNEVTAGTQQGGARKGALMISLDARHAEAENFIRIKSELGAIEQANLSLEVDNEFMEAVKSYYNSGMKKEPVIHEKREYSGHIIEYDVYPVKIFNALVDNCYDWGDPACLYVDRFRNYNIMEFDDDYQIQTCNPCGEQPLPKHGACCLSSINLSEFVKKPYTNQAEFDFDSFKEAVHIGIEALDELIDENYARHPLQEQRDMSYNYRNIGLGAFGYATALMKLGMKYGSEEARHFTDGLFFNMFREAVIKSNRLAKQKGTFPKYKECVWDSSIIKQHFTEKEINEMRPYGLRNCSLLSIAPNGSLATLLNESGGVEPEYAIQYTRRTVGMSNGKDAYYTVYCKAAKEYREKYGENVELPDCFIGSSQVDWKERVLTQGVMQDHIDTAISSTVNLPETATKEDIKNIYLLAWEKGLKGITIFRDNCKKIGILTSGNPNKNPDNDNTHAELNRGEWKQKAPDTHYIERKIKIGCGKIILMVGWSDAEKAIQDFYVIRSGQGGCERLLQATSISMSGMLRLGGTLDNIEKAIRGVGTCSSFTRERTKGSKLSPGNSCGDAILKELRKFEKEMRNQERIAKAQEKNSDIVKDKVKEVQSIFKQNNTDNGAKCPECGASLSFEGGCMTCHNCGYSKCG